MQHPAHGLSSLGTNQVSTSSDTRNRYAFSEDHLQEESLGLFLWKKQGFPG